MGRVFGVHDLSPEAALAVGTVLLTIGLAAAVRYAPRQVVFWTVGLAVLSFCVVETRYVFGRIVLGSNGNSRALSGRPLEGRDWVDERRTRQAVRGDGARADNHARGPRRP